MPAVPPPTARSYYAASAVAATAAANAALDARPRGLAAIWQVLGRFQVAQSVLATRAVDRMLDEQDVAVEPIADLNPAAFVMDPEVLDRMVADLEDDAARLTAEVEEQVQRDTDAAFARLVASLVQDAGRSAESVAIAARPRVSHVRHLNLPSCSRCAVLAGRVYRYSEGFLRHPNCFPAGTIVSGPRTRGAARRWYEGELVVIRTAGGKNLSVTGNHPVLTDQGWLPANLLAEGGYVVGRASGDRSGSLLVPDHDQMPARIEDVWRSDAMRSFGRVPVSPEDFHGDGLGSTHVDVVLADGDLRNRQQIALLQELREKLLTLRIELAVALNPSGSGLQFGGGPSLALGGGLSPFGLRGSLLGGHLADSKQSGLRGASNRNVRLDETSTNHHSAHSGPHRYRVLTLPGDVGGNDLRGVNVEPPALRWDAPAGSFSVENRAGYASAGKALFERMAGQVEGDRIIELRRVGFRGHVYNLTSSEGWYDADGIIVSNCDCVMIPVTVGSPDLTYDPAELVRSGQVTGLSKADREAIADGADFARVVNVRRTQAGLAEAGRVLRRRDRLTPEAIYRTTGDDREAAVALLKANGYLT